MQKSSGIYVDGHSRKVINGTFGTVFIGSMSTA